MPNSKNRASMGMPDLSDTIFARKFRWTLRAPHLPEQWLKTVQFDWMNKRIYAEAYEAWERPGKVAVIEWLESFTTYANEPITFTTWDGCGAAIYEYTFQDLELWKNESTFDYASSDASTRAFIVSYEKRDYKCFEMVDNHPTSFYCDRSIHDGQVEVEETEVNFLNGKTWLPGRVVRNVGRWIQSLNPRKCQSPKSTSQEPPQTQSDH